MKLKLWLFIIVLASIIILPGGADLPQYCLAGTNASNPGRELAEKIFNRENGDDARGQGHGDTRGVEGWGAGRRSRAAR